MKVVLTNLGKAAVPAVSTEDKGYAFELQPDVPFNVDSDAITVLTIGHNPSFKEDLIDALENIGTLVKRLITFWRDHAAVTEDGKPVVRVHVDNVHLEHGLRIRQGDDVSNDIELAPGATVEAECVDYVELREQGISNAAEQPEAP